MYADHEVFFATQCVPVRFISLKLYVIPIDVITSNYLTKFGSEL